MDRREFLIATGAIAASPLLLSFPEAAAAPLVQHSPMFAASTDVMRFRSRDPNTPERWDLTPWEIAQFYSSNPRPLPSSPKPKWFTEDHPVKQSALKFFPTVEAAENEFLAGIDRPTCECHEEAEIDIGCRAGTGRLYDDNPGLVILLNRQMNLAAARSRCGGQSLVFMHPRVLDLLRVRSYPGPLIIEPTGDGHGRWHRHAIKNTYDWIAWSGQIWVSDQIHEGIAYAVRNDGHLDGPWGLSKTSGGYLAAMRDEHIPAQDYAGSVRIKYV